MGQKKYLILLSSLLVLANCTPTTETVIQTKYVEKDVAIVDRPKPVDLTNPNFHVVNKDNFDEFIEEFRAKNGTETFIVISVRDYENLALNIGELRRYIEQQDEIIVYYENSVR